MPFWAVTRFPIREILSISSSPQRRTREAEESSSAGISGKLVSVGFIVFTVALGLFSYYVIPRFVTGYLVDRPARLDESFAALEEALGRYRADHGGALPPAENLLFHRRKNKNIAKSRAFGMTTVRLASLTTPVAYLDPKDSADPFAMPEQFVPPAYFERVFEAEGVRVAVLSSPGLNLIYDIRTVGLRSCETLEELEEYVRGLTYDPEKGVRSGGDFHRVLRFPLEPERE